jgi:glycosyltransferase 2 family protein
VTAANTRATAVGVRHPSAGRFEFFAAAPGGPRVRRSSDAAVAVAGVALVVILAVVRGDGTSVDEAWSAVVDVLPTWLTWSAHAVYLLSIVTAGALLVGIALLGGRRLELLRDLVLAATLAVVAVGVLTRLVDDRWPAVALTDLDQTRTTFPAFLVAAVIAVQAAAGPHLAASVRRIGWITALAGAVGAVVGGVSQLVDTAGAVLVGLTAAAVIRLAFGTSAGVPSLARVRAGLGDLGISLATLEYLQNQPPSSTILDGVTSDGVPVFVRVLDRDSWKNSQWSRAWQAAWYQETGTQHGSTRRQQIEHEALGGVLAGRAGVDVFDLVAVGEASNDDAIVVLERPPTRLAELPPDAVDDELLGQIWHQVVELHAAGLSNGRLDSSRIWVDSSGKPVLGDFSRSRITASDESMQSDVVELLVSLTLMVGQDRAIASARKALGDATLVHVLPLLQPAALTPETKHAAHRAKLKVDKLRSQTATALGVEPPKVEKLQRVSLGHVALLAFTIVAVYGLISQLADVGFSTIVDALSNATWGVVIVALIVVQLTNFTDAVSLAATSPKPVPVGITTVEQVAIGFVNLAVPSTAGRIAVNVRFFQRFGISAVASSTSATIVSALGFVSQVLLLLLTIVVGKQSIDLSKLQTGGGVPSLLLFAIAIVVVGVVLVLVVPAWRHWVDAKLRAPLHQMTSALEVLKDPKRLLTTIAGQIGTEVLYATGLMLCVLALGGSLNLGEALFINIAVSLFAGLMPVPGGVGVTEAGLTAGLTAVGVSSSIVLPAVILYRLCSYYLPPLWGWVSLRWLTHHDYL